MSAKRVELNQKWPGNMTKTGLKLFSHLPPTRSLWKRRTLRRFSGHQSPQTHHLCSPVRGRTKSQPQNASEISPKESRISPKREQRSDGKQSEVACSPARRSWTGHAPATVLRWLRAARHPREGPHRSSEQRFVTENQPKKQGKARGKCAESK